MVLVHLVHFPNPLDFRDPVRADLVADLADFQLPAKAELVDLADLAQADLPAKAEQVDLVVAVVDWAAVFPRLPWFPSLRAANGIDLAI
jgi:hypothetical protein